MNQQQYQRIKAGKTQNERVLLTLQAHANQWVAMPILARCGSGSIHGFCMVHSRVADLRRQGHDIQQLSERRGMKQISCYKLVTEVQGLATDSHESTQMEKEGVQS